MATTPGRLRVCLPSDPRPSPERDPGPGRGSVEHSKTEGLFVDPKAGRQTFGEYAERWLSTKVDVRSKTLVNIEGRLRNHVLPVFGRHAIAAITPEDVRDWVAALVRDKGLAADTVKAIS